MRYNKNTYLKILKSFGILSSSFALCACGNFANDSLSQHDDEKLSETEIHDFVNNELTNFENVDENKKTEILSFFSNNTDFFQTKNNLIKLFSIVKKDLSVLDEFIQGTKQLSNLDELEVEVVAHESDDIEEGIGEVDEKSFEFLQAKMQQAEKEQQKSAKDLIEFLSERTKTINEELETLTSDKDILMKQKNQLQTELKTITGKIKDIIESEKVLKAKKKSVEAELKKVNSPAPRKRVQASEE